MGNLCCAERFNFSVKNDKTIHADLIDFDVACAAKNVPKLLELLDSDQVIEHSIKENIYEWATPPKHLSALICVQLAVIYTEGDQNMRNEIIEGIPRLLDLLISKQPDITDSCLILLSFISSDSEEAKYKLYNNGLFVLIIDKLYSSRMNVQAIAAQLLRNVYVVKETYRLKFVSENGLEGFLHILKQKNEILNKEILSHIKDLVMQNGTVLEITLNEIRKTELIREIEDLESSIENSELKSIYNELLSILNTPTQQ